MIEVFERLVIDKDEIVREDKRTVKMLVPFSFELVDGVCVNAEDQQYYDFLKERDDVIAEDEAATETNTEGDNPDYMNG